MLKGTNLEHAKAYNLRIVLETIRLQGPISRAEVARSTNLTAQTISNIVAQLLDLGLIIEGHVRQGKRGAPSIQLEFNAEGAFSIGFDLDQEHLTAVLIDLNGIMHQRAHLQLRFPSPEEAFELMAELTYSLIASQGITEDRVWGIGVGFPGPLRITQGSVVDNVVNPLYFPGWENVPVVEKLSKQLSFPIFLENNATAAAIGESFYGAGRDIKNFFYVFLGLGLGGGLILNGQPFHGFQGNAGEIGFVLPSLKGVEQDDTFHIPNLLTRLQHADVRLSQLRELEPLLHKGHTVLLNWLDEAAQALAPALIATEYLIDPEAFIIGGVWPASLVKALVKRLEVILPPLRIEQKSYRPPLIYAEAGEDAAALGVATLPIYATLAPNPLLLNKNNQSASETLTLVGRRSF